MTIVEGSRSGAAMLNWGIAVIAWGQPNGSVSSWGPPPSWEQVAITRTLGYCSHPSVSDRA